MKNWKYGRRLENGDICKIIDIKKIGNGLIYHLTNIKNQQDFLMDKRGFEFYEEFITKDEFSI